AILRRFDCFTSGASFRRRETSQSGEESPHSKRAKPPRLAATRAAVVRSCPREPHSRQGGSDVRHWVVAALLLAGGTAVSEEARQPKRPLLYAGKTFEQWRDALDVEISPKERIEAIKALTAFGVRGRADDCTQRLLELTEEYLVVQKKGDLGDEKQVLQALM